MLMARATRLERIRTLALSLPETDEACPFGDPWFRVRGKMFCCLAEEDGLPVLVVKVGKENLALFLKDQRFFQAPYIGKHGWVCLRLDSKAPWDEVEALIRDSYRMVAPKRLRLPE